MQAVSLGLVAALLVALGLAIALAAATAAPFVAFPVFIVAFGGFLLWRGWRRQDHPAERSRAGTPSTSQAAAHPVEDSSVPDAATTGAASRPRERTRA